MTKSNKERMRKYREDPANKQAERKRDRLRKQESRKKNKNNKQSKKIQKVSFSTKDASTQTEQTNDDKDNATIKSYKKQRLKKDRHKKFYKKGVDVTNELIKNWPKKCTIEKITNLFEGVSEKKKYFYFRTSTPIFRKPWEGRSQVFRNSWKNYESIGDISYYTITNGKSVVELFGRSDNIKTNDFVKTEILQEIEGKIGLFQFEEIPSDLLKLCKEKNKNEFLFCAHKFKSENPIKATNQAYFDLILEAIERECDEYEDKCFLNYATIKDKIFSNLVRTGKVKFFSKIDIETTIKSRLRTLKYNVIENDLEFFERSPLYEVYEQLISDISHLNDDDDFKINNEKPVNIISKFKRLLRTAKFSLKSKETMLKDIIYGNDQNLIGNALKNDSEDDLEFEDDIKVKPKSEPCWKNKDGKYNIFVAFIFWSEFSIDCIKRDKPGHFFIDGTRHNVPLKNFQLIAIHYTTCDVVMTPFFILTNKFSKNAYVSILKRINKVFNITNKSFSIDFELSWREAIKYFGGTVYHCYFHYSKIIETRSRRLLRNNAIMIREQNKLYKQKSFNMQIRARVKDYLKFLIFINQSQQMQYVTTLRTEIFDLNKLETNLLEGITRDFITGKYNTFFFLKFDSPLTNNISENFFSQLSRNLTKKPDVIKFMNFMITYSIQQINQYQRKTHQDYKKDGFYYFIKSLQEPNNTINNIFEHIKTTKQKAIQNHIKDGNPVCDEDEVRITRESLKDVDKKTEANIKKKFIRRNNRLFLANYEANKSECPGNFQVARNFLNHINTITNNIIININTGLKNDTEQNLHSKRSVFKQNQNKDKKNDYREEHLDSSYSDASSRKRSELHVQSYNIFETKIEAERKVLTTGAPLKRIKRSPLDFQHTEEISRLKKKLKEAEEQIKKEREAKIRAEEQVENLQKTQIAKQNQERLKNTFVKGLNNEEKSDDLSQVTKRTVNKRY